MTTARLSTLLYWISLIPIFLIPAMWLLLLIRIDSFAEAFGAQFSYSVQWHTVEHWQLYLFMLINAIGPALLIWGIICLRRAFNAFRQNIFFDVKNAQNIKKFAMSLMAMCTFNIVLVPINSVLLSANHPAGEKILSISFNSQNLSILIVALIFWLIAKILIEANEIERENRSFV